MRKTLSKKRIKGKEYFYLSYRRGKKIVSEYLGSSSSSKFKKYLLSLVNQSSSFPLEKARVSNFKEGLPVCYFEDGSIVYEYKNGTKEYLDSLLEVLNVRKDG